MGATLCSSSIIKWAGRIRYAKWSARRIWKRGRASSKTDQRRPCGCDYFLSIKTFLQCLTSSLFVVLIKNKGGDRFRNRKGETLFIDARDIFEQISRKQVVFNKENLEKIAGTVRSWRGEKGAQKYEDVSGFCKSANLEEIKKKWIHTYSWKICRACRY